MTQCMSVGRSLDRFVFIVTLSLLLDLVSTAPTLNITTSSNPQKRSESSLLSSLALKTFGAFIKTASYLTQLLPQLPEWMRPPKPTMRVVQPAKVIRDNEDFSSEEDDFK